MAHYVICKYCKKKFDRDKEIYEQISERAFAHKACSDENNGRLTKEAQDRIALENYIKELLGQDYINAKVRNQIKDYMDEFHYTYSGMLGSLIYFYEVKKGDKSKMNQGIGIIPYCYEAARAYYKALYIAANKNVNKNIKEYKPFFEDTITISAPQKEPIRKKMFSFLEEDLPIK